MAQLIATLVAGVLAEVIGLRATSWLAPLGGLLGAAILWFSPVRTLMVLPGRADSPGTRPRTPAEVVIDVERDQPIGS